MRRHRPAPRLPAEILPPDFALRHDLFNALYWHPYSRLTPPRPWRPLDDAEWAALRPFLERHRCGLGEGAGRPMQDARGRLDAIFRAVTLKKDGGRAPWRLLPEAFGKANTAARTFRRWAARGLWASLLRAAALPGDGPPALRGLTHWICCAFRRGIRAMGLPGIVLARRLRLYSALPAPSGNLPDPDLSQIYQPVILRAVRRARERPGWRPPLAAVRLFRSMHRMMGGTRITGAMEPP